MRAKSYLALAAVLGTAIMLQAQNPTPVILQAVSPAPQVAAAPAPAANANAEAELVRLLEGMKAANEETLKKQEATLQQLAEMEKAAEQIKIYSKRG